MRDIATLLILFILLLTMAGCGNNQDTQERVNNENFVEKVIGGQMEKYDSESNDVNPEDQGADTTPKSEMDVEGNPSQTEQEDINTQNTDEVDYDLTAMSSDMVYATVYQMMVNPDAYVGKTIRVDGVYYGSYYEPTAKYYHNCIIQDALACCAQRIEFIWDDGTHKYPDEYPAENTEIIVQGMFETYQEEGDANLYCRLQNASLEIADNN